MQTQRVININKLSNQREGKGVKNELFEELTLNQIENEKMMENQNEDALQREKTMMITLEEHIATFVETKTTESRDIMREWSTRMVKE